MNRPLRAQQEVARLEAVVARRESKAKAEPFKQVRQRREQRAGYARRSLERARERLGRLA